MYICENCEKEHNGSYGSGRFCSLKCARGFSTKFKRKEINLKVSKKLSSPKIQKICKCGKSFITNKTSKENCSRKCASYYNNIGKPKKKGSARKKGSGGPRNGGGHSKQLSYSNWLGESMKLNMEEIKIAEILDYKKLNWKRNWEGFTYIDLNGRKRKFYPDFIVNESTFIEYKGWLTDKMRHKMKDAKEKNNIELIIVVGEDIRFKNDGISIKQFEQLEF